MSSRLRTLAHSWYAAGVAAKSGAGIGLASRAGATANFTAARSLCTTSCRHALRGAGGGHVLSAKRRPLVLGTALSLSSSASEAKVKDAVRSKHSIRWNTTSSSRPPSSRPPSKSDSLTVLGTSHPTDDHTNVPPSILSRLRDSPVLPYSPSHPLRLLRERIEAFLPHCTSLPAPSPVVSTQLNFSDLGFPEDHPGRAPSDTYYLNRGTCLRTHTSAHEVQTFRAGHDKWLLTADVYRRDEVDASHYPVFHQMEGASVWGPGEDVWGAGGIVEKECERMEQQLKNAAVVIEDEVSLDAAGGWQEGMDQKKAQLAMRHLKATLNGLALHLFGPRHEQDVREAAAARAAAGGTAKGGPVAPTEAAGSFSPPPAAPAADDEALRVRWIDATFPFTTPSFEVEVWFRGRWLEILGCGVVKQATLDKAGVPEKLGWAFGLGLERIAMVLYSIPDIRLFWTQDPRFLDQFSAARSSGTTASQNDGTSAELLPTFRPYSRYPPCYKDVSFWLPSESASSDGTSSTRPAFHPNDLAELLRDEAADLVESLTPLDDFVHPKTGRRSLCLRVMYRSMERSLENKEVNALHDNVVRRMRDELGLEIR